MPDTDDTDKKVKDLLDAGTRAELERWFGLPSFEQLADQGVKPEPPEDPEVVELRRRREAAIAAVDPRLFASILRRGAPPLAVLQPRREVKLHIDPDVACFDQTVLDRQQRIADPRELERPSDIEDVLRESTPQALLRDLHRPVLDFNKAYERVDLIDLVDAAAEVAVVMASSTKLPSSPSRAKEAAALLLELRAERKRPWTEIEMPLRRVTE
jgi:hypothetical protein